MKINLAIMFGGVSCEHDISIITAMQAVKNLNTVKYNVIPIYITKGGQWLSGKKLLDIEYFKSHAKGKATSVTMLPNDNFLYKKTKIGLKKWMQIDVALLAFHGLNGEDGTISGLCELNQIPYTACSIFSSSLCCDKVSFKYYIKGLGLKSAKFVTVTQTEFNEKSKTIIDKIVSKLGYPLIVKPSKLGSSIGISVCNNLKELTDAIDLGFSLDEQLLIEQYLTDIREINCAVVGMGSDIIVSELEEPIKTNKILSFENKYINSHKNGDMEFTTRKMPPNISKELYNKVVSVSKLLFSKLNLKGVIRIDYIVTKQNELLVNEINTIPGSFANYLFKPKDISFAKLLDKLVSTAISESILKQQKIKTFQSDVLNSVSLDDIKK